MTSEAKLTAARSARAATNKQIIKLEKERRDALLDDDDTRAASLDHELAALRRAVQRHADKLRWLEEIEREAEIRHFPTDVVGTRERIAQLQQRQAALMRRPKLDRSAVDDHEINVIRGEIQTLDQHIKLMERTARAVGHAA